MSNFSHLPSNSFPSQEVHEGQIGDKLMAIDYLRAFITDLFTIISSQKRRWTKHGEIGTSWLINHFKIVPPRPAKHLNTAIHNPSTVDSTDFLFCFIPDTPSFRKVRA